MLIEGEECKFIDGTDEFYAVSVTGKVWSFMNSHRNKAKIPKIVNQHTTMYGYKEVRLGIKGSRKHYPVHRLVAKAFIPNPQNLRCVNHKNEDKSYNRVENLEWCTHEYNNNYGTHNDRVSKTLTKFVCPVKLVYLRKVKKMTRGEIAKEFNVSGGTIRNHLLRIGLW